MKKNTEFEKQEIVLFLDKTKCCGCGVCMNACAQGAISMKEDEEGFLYPVIEREKCVECGLCNRVCAYQSNDEGNCAEQVFAATIKNNDMLKKSASGGVFAALASEILANGGSVFGCSMEIVDGMLTPMHIKIERIDDLPKLQGSKYVQSITGNVYKMVKEELQLGKYTLFSGTPCQVAGLKKYLGNKRYEKLFLIDIICHGVPSVKFFQSYIQECEKKVRGTIVDLRFRDKGNGWGLRGKLIYFDKYNKCREKIIFTNLSSYYKLFLKSDTYRESCYSCRYAGKSREGDLTIGDYWGIERVHPEYLRSNGGVLDARKGISCVLVNSEQGKEMLKQFGSNIVLKDSNFNKVANQNQQLKFSSTASNNRNEILRLFKLGGYKAVDKWYYKQLGIKKYIYVVWNKLPEKIQILIRKLYE